MAEKPGLLIRAWNVLLQRGPLSVAETVITRVAHFIYEHHEGYILERDLHEPIEQLQAKTPCECKFLETDEEIDQVATVFSNRPREDIKGMLDAGKRCVIVKAGEKIVRVGWSDSGDVYLPKPSGRVFSKKKLVTFPEGYAYTEGSYTLPEERRKGYTNACDSFHLLALAELGFHKVITTIACKNEPMLRGAKKTGHRLTKRVNYCRILGIRFRKVEDVTEPD